MQCREAWGEVQITTTFIVVLDDHLAGDLPVTDFLVLIPGVAAGPGTYLTDMETELSIF